MSHQSNHAAPVLLLGLVFGIGLTPGCLGDQDECQTGDDFCRNGIAHTCGSNPNFGGSTRVWRTERCASSLCAVARGRATCVLDETPDPRCVDEGSYCVNDTDFVACIGGYVVFRGICSSCLDGTCEGSLGSDCPSEGCAQGLTCSTGRCSLACECDEGSACEQCTEVSQVSTTNWICLDGQCAAEPK